ncbi:MAG: putative phage protein [Streptosporangiaceae bacterium]|nr:putative phage protein [Streptosporangiaceae bacterium]
MARSEQEWLTHLITCHDQQKSDLSTLDSYYEGRQPLSYMAPELIAEMQDRIRQVVVNWPRLVVDSMEERLDVEGFRLAGAAQSDERLWSWWQANDLDEESQLGHLDALAMRRSFVIVGADDDENPLITVESPLEVHAERDPRTRQVAAAVKRWSETEGATKTEFATLYRPDATVWSHRDGGAWVEYDRDDHNLGVVPVVPLVNRARTRNREGVSELADIIPLSDAACKIATDMMVSAEYHAVPRRVAFGFSESDFVDEQGRPVTAFSRVVGRMWATEKSKLDGADVVQFPEASLTNFHDTINSLATLVASLSGLPPHFLGMTTDNPASADAIRSSEARLIKRAERKQRAFGGAWEQVMRLATRIQTGEWDAGMRGLETIWRDASTPTIAQASDAATKKYSTGIVPLRQTREDLGYTQEQIARMEEADLHEDPVARAIGPNPAAAVGPKPVTSVPADATPAAADTQPAAAPAA